MPAGCCCPGDKTGMSAHMVFTMTPCACDEVVGDWTVVPELGLFLLGDAGSGGVG